MTPQINHARSASTQPAGPYLGNLLATLVDGVRQNAARFRESHHEEALHQLRISVRRLRAAASFVHPLARAEPAIASANKKLRALALPFGEVRDLDVIGAAIDDGEGPAAPHHAAEFRAAIADRRRGAAHESEAVLASRRWTRTLEQIESAALGGRWRDTPGARGHARHYVSHELDTWWWKLTARWHDLADLSPQERHRVRMTAKKLRYLTELTADLYVEREAEQASSSADFKEVQDHLGEIQDRVAGAELVRAYEYDPAPQAAARCATGGNAVDDAAHADAAALTRAVDVKRRMEAATPYWQ